MTLKFANQVACALASIASIITVSVGPAMAKEICSVPKAQWQPQSSLVRKLEGQGWKIRNMKIDSGCYEVYGTDGSGKSRETHFNPATLQAAAEEHR